MQPPFAGSQVGAEDGHRLLSARCEQRPPLQVSTVQSILSLLQSASPQQVLQPSAQHFMPSAQLVKLHFPLTHEPV
jgi:hypothetical protein